MKVPQQLHMPTTACSERYSTRTPEREQGRSSLVSLVISRDRLQVDLGSRSEKEARQATESYTRRPVFCSPLATFPLPYHSGLSPSSHSYFLVYFIACTRTHLTRMSVFNVPAPIGSTATNEIDRSDLSGFHSHVYLTTVPVLQFVGSYW